jgi:hypothetical protein
MKLILLNSFIAIILLSSCYTQKKAAKAVLKAQATYPNIVAKSCALWYPPKVYDSTRFEYVVGETEYYIDTVRFDCDSLVNANKSAEKPTGKIEKQVLPTEAKSIATIPINVPKLRVDTYIDHQYRWYENTANLELIQSKLDSTNEVAQDLNIDRKIEQKSKSDWRLISLILLGYLAIKTSIRLFVPQLSFIKKLP